MREARLFCPLQYQHSPVSPNKKSKDGGFNALSGYPPKNIPQNGEAPVRRNFSKVFGGNCPQKNPRKSGSFSDQNFFHALRHLCKLF